MAKLRRFFLNIVSPSIGEKIVDIELKNRIFNVLRLTENSFFEITNGSDKLITCTIKNKNIIIEKTENFIITKQKSITVWASIIKKERFDFIVEKATELNATEIIPIISERTKQYKNMIKQIARWQKISDQSLSQCMRLQRMKIHNPITLEKLVNIDLDNINKIVLDPYSKIKLSNISNKKKHIGILVGPEGGFTKEEISLTKKNGFIGYSLDSMNILRSETAVINSLSVLNIF